MHSSPEDFYSGEVTTYQEELKIKKKRLIALGMLRLLSFVLTGFGIYYTINIDVWPIIIGVVGFSAFLFLVSRYADAQVKKKQIEYLIEINRNELKRLSGEAVKADSGKDFIDDTHAYSSDIDLFGEGSFFQMINRTELKESRIKLANILKSNAIENIVEKQNGVKELAAMPKWRQNYKMLANHVKSEIPRSVIVEWMNTYSSFIPKFVFILSRIFPVVSFLAFVLYGFGFLSSTPLLIMFFGGLLVSSFFIKKINKLSIHVSQLKSAFSNYSKLIEEIEKTEFKSEICQKEKEKIKSDTERASAILNQFSKHLSALDQRNNILFAVLGNGFLLWDCHHAYKIENWISLNNSPVEKWFETIEFFDAYNSLGTFAFNHPTYNYPEINEQANFVIQTKQIGHLMIDPVKRVDNDFEILSSNFKIITGANMAGKSTFLRTMATAIVSANIGLPLCSKKTMYKPVKLITSMRNTDSLQDDSSYFFSELVRLKFIVDAIKDNAYFIILDEILKGTNSKDKEEGSKKLMRKLSKSDSCGIIATHDLGLCEIANDIPTIQNHYFDAEIIDNELFFDYTLKDGVCQNMNASFLLKKMEIV